MNEVLSPIVSESETEEQATSYDRWFRAKVLAAIKSDKPRVLHDQVMAEIYIRLGTKRMGYEAGRVERRSARRTLRNH